MKMINITGWKYIYSFTFKQAVKSKSYRVSFVILCLIAAFALPVAAILNGDSVNENVAATSDDVNDKEKSSKIKEVDTIYLQYDESDKGLADTIAGWTADYKCKYKTLDEKEFEEKKSKVNDDNSYALMLVEKNELIYNVTLITGWETMGSMESIEKAADNLGKRLERLQISNVTGEDNYAEVDDTNIFTSIGDGKKSGNGGFSFFTYMLQLGYVIVFIFILSFCGESIATSVVSEKAGKMVEFLMITVKPMAILVGKVLGVITTVLLQVFGMISSALISFFVCNNIFDNKISDYLTHTIEMAEESDMKFSVSPFNVVLMILFIIGGLFFYCLLASIAGASVSKIEEVSEGIVLFTFTLIIGSYMAIGLAMNLSMGGYTGETGMFEWLVYMLPISSAFSVPQNLMAGYIGYGPAVISLLILYLAVIFLATLSARVYECMLFYNGARLKVKDIIYIAAHGRVRG